MSSRFAPGRFVLAPDGTEVDAFLNVADNAGGRALPHTLGDVSVAAGRLRPRTRSAIHAHPVVTQLTCVVSGQLTARAQDAAAPPREFVLEAGEVLLTAPGEPLQLCNETDAGLSLLYVVTPAYVVARDGGRVTYEDAVLLKSWDGPLSQRVREEATKARAAALARMGRGEEA